MTDKKNNFLKNWPLLIFLVLLLGPMLGKYGVLIIIAVILIILLYKYFNLKKLFPNSGLNSRANSARTVDLDKTKFMKNSKHIIVISLIVVFGLWLFFASIVVVNAGETGVYSLFGRVKDKELRSGFHLVIPFAKVTKMSIRTEEYTMSIVQGEGKRASADAINALTKEGLSIDLDITTLYHLKEESASDLYKNTAQTMDQLAEKIIRPTIRTSIRDIIAQYEAKDIYSEKREEAAEKILESLKKELGPRGIVAETVLLRNVVLPATINTAIQEKLQAEQEAQKYDFILQKEAKEKERKVIEAEGQRDAQRIINESLTQNYLYFLYVSNLKDREGTIYVPTSPSTGMPLFRDIGR